jgi:predicted small metal-binding protein
VTARQPDGMTFAQACPRCGEEFAGDDRDSVADQVVAHATDDHGHALDRDIVLPHLDGRHPHD